METIIMGAAMTQQLAFEKFDYKGELPNTLEEGNVYSVRLMLRGESIGDVKDVPLFIREHLVQQDKLFNNFLVDTQVERRTLYVTGSPGCGKTAFTTLLAHRYAAGRTKTPPTIVDSQTNNQNKRVLMILFRQEDPCDLFIVDGVKTERLRGGMDWNEMYNTVRTMMFAHERFPSFDLCILDGVRQTLDACGLLMQSLRKHTGQSNRIKKVIFITSLQFRLKAGDIQIGFRSQHETINFDSFTQDDYDSAVTNPSFRSRLLECEPKLTNDVLRYFGKSERDSSHDTAGLSAAAISEYFKYKYYYAGGNARYMFECSILQVKNRLQTLFGQASEDSWKGFTTSMVAPGTSSAVNSLMQQFRGYTSAVSLHVLFEAYDRMEGNKLVKAVQVAAEKSDNPVLKGWAFELQQLHTIKTVLTANSRGNSPKQSFLRSEEGLCFQPVKNGEASFDGNQLIKDENVDLKSGTIIWCMKWNNQGCFDVAFFKNNTLMTLQFTLASSHSLKLQYIRDLKNAIEKKNCCSGTTVGSVIHVGVVGSNVFRGFSFNDPEGLGRHSQETRQEFTLETYKSSELIVESGGRNQSESFGAIHLGNLVVYTRKRQFKSE
eukprot:scaffold970_cov65-Cylindrotheca_fusiformis.AAC.2